MDELKRSTESLPDDSRWVNLERIVSFQKMEWRRILQLAFILVLLLTISYLYVCTLHFSSEYFLHHYRQVVIGSLETVSDFRKTYAKLKYGQYVTLCSGSYDSRRVGNQLFNFATLMYVANPPDGICTCQGMFLAVG